MVQIMMQFLNTNLWDLKNTQWQFGYEISAVMIDFKQLSEMTHFIQTNRRGV